MHVAASDMVVTPKQALAFVRKHGVVLESARGMVPSLAETIAGQPIRGSWWSHPRGEEIFKLTLAVRDSQDVLVCRLIDDKITYVHSRLWPALVRVARRFPRKRLAQVREVHTDPGRHVLEELAFPKWVPAEVLVRAERLSDDSALSLLERACASRGR